MDVDSTIDKILIPITSALVGAIIWIYRFGGRVKAQEIAFETLSDDVASMDSRVLEIETDQKVTSVRLMRIDTTQKHMSETLDRVLRILENK